MLLCHEQIFKYMRLWECAHSNYHSHKCLTLWTKEFAGSHVYGRMIINEEIYNSKALYITKNLPQHGWLLTKAGILKLSTLFPDKWTRGRMFSRLSLCLYKLNEKGYLWISKILWIFLEVWLIYFLSINELSFSTLCAN